MSGIEKMLELMSRPSPPAPEGVYMVRPLAEAALAALEAKSPLSSEVRDLRAVLAEPNEQLWAIHSVGPGEEFPCLNKEDAEKRAQELRGIGERLKQERIAKGESIEHWCDWIVNVIPSPWEPAEHFEIMAQEWTDDADQLREKVTVIIAERDQLKAQIEALSKDLAGWQSVVAAVKRETPLHFSAGSRGNAPGHCHSVPGVWDGNNGSLSGTKCAWCIAWNAAMNKEPTNV